jgi:hypothetical protein
MNETNVIFMLKLDVPRRDVNRFFDSAVTFVKIYNQQPAHFLVFMFDRFIYTYKVLSAQILNFIRYSVT